MTTEPSTGERSHHLLVGAIYCVIALATVLLGSVIAAYALRFSANGVSDEPAIWGQFGDFVGGTANPVLAFLSLVILSLTIVIQSRQLAISSKELELSRRELELTREELRRSAKAQEDSEKALRDQADASNRSTRLSSVNSLLRHYQDEIGRLHRESFMTNDPRSARLKQLTEREATLLSILDGLYDSLSGGANAS